jgi:membrane peptidoglycan carboxypeptidase
MPGHERDTSNVFSLLAALVATAMVMGLLAAGILIPAVGAAGAAAKSGVDLFDSLPGEFQQSPLSQQSRIVDAKGGLITTPYDENRIIVQLDQISPWMRKAQIAIEDARFYEHGGVDPRSITRALISNFQGGEITQGASTLTQQFVKITLQENALRQGDREAAKAATAKSYTRKLQEMKYAVTLEQTLTKDQILAGYLNLVYYGDKAYGVEAAARHYFNVHASKLTLAQAATLAGVVRQPGNTDPRNNPSAAQARRDVVLNRMEQLGMITSKQKHDAMAVPVAKLLHITDDRANTCAVSKEPYFCEYILAYLKDMSNHSLDFLGKSLPERVNTINRGGLTIRTTLDPDLQRKARQEITQKVPIANKEHVGAAATVIEPGTGKVLAMAQASKYGLVKSLGQAARTGTTQVNWNVDTKFGGTTGFAFGSTAKMFALVTALKQGMPINSDIYAKFATTKKPAVYLPSEMHDSCRSGEPWEVRNDESIGGGTIPLKTAIAKSINTAFASLVVKLGGCSVLKNMGLLGLHQGSGAPIQPYPSAITLGSDSVTPLTMASSYATLAADGKYCQPNPLISITTSDKKDVALPKTPCKQVIDEQVARGVTLLLEGVIDHGTGTGAKLAGGRPAAGKTGTTDGHTESWFIGYTPQRAAAVWVGTPYSQTTMRNLHLGGSFYRNVFGGTIAAPLWGQIMDSAMKGLPFEDFTNPNDKTVNGDTITIPNVIGRSVSEAKSILKSAGFESVVAGYADSNVPRGQVAATNPSGRAPKGATIGLIVSSGFQGPTATGNQSTPSPFPFPFPFPTRTRRP